MLREGILIAGRYEVIGRVGSGGMSDVYKAKDHSLNRFVAVKVLKAEFSDDRTFVNKFRIEAQSAAGLTHPNIVNTYDVGSENGIHYIVMELIEGITLKTYIEKKGQLTIKEATSIAIQVAMGIEAAHTKHIIHRDIKPQNIIISTEGKVKVTDFGIAKAATSNTINADVMGSVHYASPEQARNGYVDGKSDIYSLGIVMYEMVTGRVPFDGETTVAIAIQHLQDEIIWPREYVDNIPISTENIILKCTQKSADRRYGDIADVIIDLKKSLITPNEDFVSTGIVDRKAKTMMIPEEDLETIKRTTDRVYYKKDTDIEDDESIEDNEGELNPKMEKAITIMGIIAAVIIVCIILYIVGSFMGMFKFGAKGNSEKENDIKVEEPVVKDEEKEASDTKVTMIQVVGSKYEDAKTKLNEISLGITKISEEASDQYPAGYVISQSIEEGTKLEKNVTIEVVVSTGAAAIQVPDTYGLEEEQGRNRIKDYELEPKVEYAHNDTVPNGSIISTNPTPGSSAKKGDVITLTVSRGKETVTVPEVLNLKEEEARVAFANAGVNVGSVTSENNDVIPTGSVIRQSLNGGKQVEKGTTVDLVVSAGKKDMIYSYNAKLEAPSDSNGTKINYSANITLTLSESDEVVFQQSNVTSFPASIDTTSKNNNTGILTIVWSYEEVTKDEAGNILTKEPKTSIQETTVTFTLVQ